MASKKLNVQLISHTPNPEEVIATAAKLCYSDSSVGDLLERIEDSDVSKFISGLYDLGHLSPFEHASFTFAIEGVSRSLTHQLVRHRISSFSQQSQRYVSALDFDYIVPKPMLSCPEAAEMYKKTMEQLQSAYNQITSLMQPIFFKQSINEYLEKHGLSSQEDIPFEDSKFLLKASLLKAYENARYVLPNAAETKIIVTMNARSLLHFFEQRCCYRAQEEIRDLANEMLKLVKAISPNVFKKAGPRCVSLGHCSEGKMTCGRISEVRAQYL